MKDEINSEKPNAFEQVAKKAAESSEQPWFQAVVKFTTALAKEMESCGINRTQLAERLNVHPSFITKVLKGDTNISIGTIAKLSKALNCNFGIYVTPKDVFIDQGYKPLSENNNTGGEGAMAPPAFSRFLKFPGNLAVYCSPYR